MGRKISTFKLGATAPPQSAWEKIRTTVVLQFIIIRHIWWHVLLVSLYCAAIVCLHKYYESMFYMPWDSTIVPVLGIVAGLLLVFRTNTSYDRYYEARRLWDLMTRNIRLLTKWIWIIVSVKDTKDMIEKRCAINLCLAFAIASKHYLRQEYSYNYDDLKDLTKHLPKMFPEPKKDIKSKANSSLYRSCQVAPPTNIPLEINFYLNIYIFSMKKKEGWDPSISGMMFAAANSLNECLTGFERILRTPIPVAYTVHLYHVIWLYILSLPYQLVHALGWWTIPAVCIASFTCSGILAIGSEIEDPFGYDANDLPLDEMCQMLAAETNAMLGNELPQSEDLFMSTDYCPLPNCKLNTKEMSQMSVHDMQDLLRVVAAAHIPDSPRPKLRNLKNSEINKAFDNSLTVDSAVDITFTRYD